MNDQESFGVTEFVNRVIRHNPEKNLVFEDLFKDSVGVIENAGMYAFIDPNDKNSGEVKFTEEAWMRMGTNYMLHKMTGL